MATLVLMSWAIACALSTSHAARADALDRTSGTETWSERDSLSREEALDVMEETLDFWEWSRAWWRYDQALMRRVRQARQEPESVPPPRATPENRQRRLDRIRRTLEQAR